MFEREFLCFSRDCVDPNGERTILGIIRRSGDLDITGDVHQIIRTPTGWSISCGKCQTTRAYFGRTLHWHAEVKVA